LRFLFKRLDLQTALPTPQSVLQIDKTTALACSPAGHEKCCIIQGNKKGNAKYHRINQQFRNTV
jgi:hypothetical protein